MFKKNTAVTGFGIGNFINATTGATVTTGTPTCKRTLDGTAGACANAAAYDATGLTWKIDLVAGDTNADMVVLAFTLTDCLPITYTIRTTTLVVDAAGLADANVVKVGPTGSGTAQTAGDLKAAIDAVPTDTENADALLKRDWNGMTGEAARSMLNALRFLRNKWSISAGTLTVTKEDDSTSAWTATVATTEGANPITTVDPA